MSPGWALCAKSGPRNTACLAEPKRLQVLDCKHVPRPCSRGCASRAREWDQAEAGHTTHSRAGLCGEPPPPLTLAPGQQMGKGGPSSQVAGRVAISIVLSNKTLTQMTLCCSPNVKGQNKERMEKQDSIAQSTWALQAPLTSATY